MVGSTNPTSSTDIAQVIYDDVYPEFPAELTDRARTANFIRSTRAIQKYNMSSMEQIFFRVATLKLLDPTLSNLPTTTKNQFIAETQLMQNSNGGFGAWKKDGSDLSSTYLGVQIFEWLGHSYDKGLVQSYLDRLRNLVSDGFNSNLQDGDSDAYSTSTGILAYTTMGLLPANSSNLVSKLQNAQNLNAASVPANEIGGVGYQTNSLTGVYWSSEVPVTSIAISALNSLSSNLTDISSAVTFIQSMQLSSGGFVKTPSIISSSITYTAAALKALNLLSSAPVDAVKAESYVRSYETSNGGFLLKSSSTEPSLRGTYYGVLALSELGKTPINVTATENYMLNMPFLQDGFGSNPGASPSLRETFDAVASFSYMRRSFAAISGITNYVSTYANPDGGYGRSGSFMDSTSRAVAVYSILNVTTPNAVTTISFIQGLQQSDGGFSKKASNFTSFIVSTYRAVSTLYNLGAEPSNKAATISYLQGLQNIDGGFGGYGGDTSDVSSTYRAVRALSLLGAEPLDKAKAVSYLQGAQNQDGGFKRSPADVLRPKNISQAIYTYSSVRALSVLGAAPLNISGVYDYVVSLRNNDGGYGPHTSFSSNIAYTFSSLWILANFHKISGFSLGIPQDWNTLRSQYDNTTIKLNGGYAPYVYNVSESTHTLDFSGVSSQSGEIVIDTHTLPVGNYTFSILITDFTGSYINASSVLMISDVIATTPTSSTTSATSTTNTTSTTTISTTSSTSTTSTVSTTTTSTVSTSTTSTTSTVSTPPPPSSTAKSSPGLTIFIAAIALAPVALLRRRK